eukprot:CAMPEP_0178917614 /NCGR_PEP_ID=MMETSP0786-20121207/13343_1 /TAXON_ID=186022 /ORGANISM="Thalassionema frauenfeldii, Strain CCMP 1798" /LENGTH=154 /DNA_ID=CAMNT_0020591181 /DNA_START=61 /DNA_END=522 /DNA_ORIENTATION=+
MKNKQRDNARTVENEPLQKRRKLSRDVEGDNDEMYVSTNQFSCNELIKEEEVPTLITEEREEEPSLVIESRHSIDNRISCGSDKAQLQQNIIKSRQHIRGKDLNRLLEQHNNTNDEENLSNQENLAVINDRSSPSMESCMGRHFYPIDEEGKFV